MRRFAACLTVLGLALPAGQADGASFQGLGDLEGGALHSQALAVSADGSVVVGYSDSADGAEAFRWTAGTGMVGLGDLPGAKFQSCAWGVSADGSVVVGASKSASSGDIYNEAFRWTAAGGMVGLGDLPGGKVYSSASDVSADGSVVVGWGCKSSDSLRAVRWTALGGMVELGDLGGGEYSIGACGVSADGSVVVGYGHSASGHEAFRWTAGEGMAWLADLPGATFWSQAEAVSADGLVVVGSGHSAASGDWYPEAFRWTAATGMVGLGALPGGDFFSGAYDVSADGSVVVGNGRSVWGQEAFIWDPTNGMRSLNDVLRDDYGVDVPRACFQYVTAISPNGRAIVGYGSGPSGGEGWLVLLDPLELNWVSGSGGAWDTTGNWGFSHPATEMTDVFIQPETGLTVTGPTATTTIKSLTLGAQSGSATLKLQNNGTLNVTETTTIERGKLTGDGTLNAAGGITNYGEIDLGTRSLQLVGGTLTNYGAVHGHGQIDNTLSNTAFGQIWGESRMVLVLSGPGNTNAGQINLGGGNIVFAQDLTNSPGGFIAGRGMLTVAGGLTNDGIMALSGGFADLYGDVTNSSGAKIVVSGGSTTTFYDDVHNYLDTGDPNNNGEIRIGINCNAVFFGALTGAGTTGPGTAYIEGDLRPGNSAAAISFGGDVVFGSTATFEIELDDPANDPPHDLVNVAGDVYLGGTLTLQPIDVGAVRGNASRTILTADGPGRVSGTFADVPAGLSGHLDMGVFYQSINYDPASVSVNLFTAEGGDGNGDGRVDTVDITNLVANFGFPDRQWTDNDTAGGTTGRGDGKVDTLDITDLVANFGIRPDPGPAPEGWTIAGDNRATGEFTPIPEPSALVLLGMGTVGLLVYAWRQRRCR